MMNEVDTNLAFSYYSKVFKTRLKIPWSELTEKEKQGFLTKAKRRLWWGTFIPGLKWEHE